MYLNSVLPLISGFFFNYVVTDIPIWTTMLITAAVSTVYTILVRSQCSYDIRNKRPAYFGFTNTETYTYISTHLHIHFLPPAVAYTTATLLTSSPSTRARNKKESYLNTPKSSAVSLYVKLWRHLPVKITGIYPKFR